MVPMGAVADIRFAAGPDRVSHYNVYLASDINGQAAPGISSGPGHRRHGARAARHAAERLRL